MSEETNLPAVPTDDATFKDMMQGGNQFLARIMLMHPLSQPCMDGKAQAGHFLFGVDRDIGKEFRAVIGPWRPHALLLVNQEVKAESFQPESETFKAIEEEARGAKQEDRAPLYGLDFLLWVPEAEAFGVYFFNKTARREAPTFRTLTSTPEEPKVVTVYAFLVETKRYKWHVPKCRLDESGEEFLQPTPEQIEEATKLFMNPDVADTEPAEGSDRVR